MAKYSEEIKQQARELYSQGLSQSEIGRNLKIQVQTIHRWVNPEAAERHRKNSRRYYQENPERRYETSRCWAQENAERVHALKKRWAQNNPERIRNSSQRWKQKNAERSREYSRQWAKENPERKRESNAFRRAAKRQATPPWLTTEQRKQMTALHAKARRLERRTGIPHHVDHIVPLHAKLDSSGEQIACGLHVPWNLQILPGHENCSKNCKLPGPEEWIAV